MTTNRRTILMLAALMTLTSCFSIALYNLTAPAPAIAGGPGFTLPQFESNVIRDLRTDREIMLSIESEVGDLKRTADDQQRELRSDSSRINAMQSDLKTISDNASSAARDSASANGIVGLMSQTLGSAHFDEIRLLTSIHERLYATCRLAEDNNKRLGSIEAGGNPGAYRPWPDACYAGFWNQVGVFQPDDLFSAPVP